MRLSALAVLLSLFSGPALAQSPAPFTISETGRSFGNLAQAVDAIGDADGTILIAPGRYADCAVQTAGRVAFVAREPGTVTFDGGICEGKATLVLRGRAAHVEGLRFTRQNVPDGNGAGIRLERSNLSVVRSHFVDAQSGILSGDDPAATITIDRSTFSGLGKHPNGHGAHGIYIGQYGALKITASRFERGTGGHYVKSRAPRIEVLDSSFDDSHGRETNYLIDLPNGATGRIAGNSFVNGLGKENHTAMITIAPEGRINSSQGLIIEGNRAWTVPGYPWTTAFIGNWSGDEIIERGNVLAPRLTKVQRLSAHSPAQLIRSALALIRNRTQAWLTSHDA
ncbi:right-handed parallel beta-helix repeat-containing protein [Novosphingobium sp. M1R2S20]|uniref:Right-handed parallel beta-helix repeat-containing protein n=1 Tax=Novosphingobium rhizovicinum TaxID=3228928 RepID=A0ABV3R9H4_9SPHN